jgi:tripartite-type tricarboxylate transporter receptor subunit TctC
LFQKGKEIHMRNIKSLLFKSFGIMFAFAIVLTFYTAVLAADAYPSKPMRLIVPTAPGGGQDNVARLIGPKLSERLGQQVFLDNRAGGGGIIATEMVAKAKPDGYTMLIINPTATIQPALQELPYDMMKSFIPIAKLASATQTLVVHPSVPANSVRELITLAKTKPGQLIFSSPGTGTVGHLNVEVFKMMAGIDFKIVQFKSAGPALVDLLGGHSHALFTPTTGSVPHIKSGKLRVLGTGGEKRSVFLPDVPIIAETIPGFYLSSWYGILVTAGTPAPIVERLNKEIKEILNMDEVKKQLLAQGAEVDYMGLDEFKTFFGQEIARWASVIKKANITVND